MGTVVSFWPKGILPKWRAWNVLEEGRFFSGRQDAFWKSGCTVGRGVWTRCWMGRPEACSPRPALSSVHFRGWCVCGGWGWGILPLQPLTPEENCANLKRIHQLNNKIKESFLWFLDTSPSHSLSGVDPI